MCALETTNELYDIFTSVLETSSYAAIARYLNVASGTVKRWKTLGNVPWQYRFELMKLAGIDIDYTKYDYKEKDQFFTPVDTASYCYHKLRDIIEEYDGAASLDKYTWIEPSAGNGKFFNILPIDKRVGIDIEPRCDDVMESDYLDWVPDNNDERNYIVVGNPPFGLRGHLALKFINHSATFADYVGFVLPQLIESDGKGVPRKRVKGLNLIHSEKLHSAFEDPDGSIVSVECIFQVWSKYHTNEKYIIRQAKNNVIKVYSLSDGGTPSTTRNKRMFYACDMYLPSTCFGKENMRYYENFDELPGRRGYGIVFLEEKNRQKNIDRFRSIDWSSVAFLSTNSAYNIRTSQIEEQFTQHA